MSIHSIRSLDLNDPVPLLGRKVEVKSLDGTLISGQHPTGQQNCSYGTSFASRVASAQEKQLDALCAALLGIATKECR